MPRVSREQTGKNRLEIEEVSSHLFRERGLNGVSVADLMGAAGLTHGGFYGHFASKDVLAAVACTSAFRQSAQRWRQRIDDNPGCAAAKNAIVEAYLSAGHREDAGDGCPAAALAADVAREPVGKPVRAAYLEGVKELVARLAALNEGLEPPGGREDALVQLSTMVGAMLLARATGGDAISDEILAAARGFLVHP